MPLPFLVAAGIAAIGAGVGAIANETRREKEERERKNSLEYRIHDIHNRLRNGNYRVIGTSRSGATETSHCSGVYELMKVIQKNQESKE